MYDINGNKNWYYIENDIYCFKLKDEIKYSGETTMSVDTLKYWKNVTSKFNEIQFRPNASINSRMNQIIEIQNSPNFVMSSVALTSKKPSNSKKNNYNQTDDRILITFNNPNINKSEVQTFAKKYNLNVIHQPNSSLPRSLNWTYVFKFKPIEKGMTTIKLAQIINEHEAKLVKFAEPNIYSVIPASCSKTPN